MIIEYKKTSDLIPYVNNTRTHSDEQVNQIASSIKEFGFTNPVLLDENRRCYCRSRSYYGCKEVIYR
jgi:hypothetical protein